MSTSTIVAQTRDGHILEDQGRAREGGVDIRGDNQPLGAVVSTARPKNRAKTPKEDLGKRVPKPEGGRRQSMAWGRSSELPRMMSECIIEERRRRGVSTGHASL